MKTTYSYKLTLGLLLSSFNLTPCVFAQTAPDFHLRPDSPAIDAGICLPEVKTDFDGNPRPQGKGCDIGAYEFVPTDTTPPSPPRNPRLQSDEGEIVPHNRNTEGSSVEVRATELE